MPYRFEPRPDYLSAVYTGTFALNEALEAISAAFAACNEHKLERILFDASRLEGNPSINDRYALGVRLAEADGRSMRIALVVNPASWLSDRPMENIAVNRGACFMSTTDIQKARHWLGIAADA
jgi:hypothetical protein